MSSRTDVSTGVGDNKVVSIENISKIYGSGDETVTALEDIDIDLGEGEFLSLVGPSGCGKSTLLHITSGILEPTEGQVRINSVDVQASEHPRHSVGLVFQQPVLLEWRTVVQNILLPTQIMLGNGLLSGEEMEYENRAHDLIELVGLEGFEDSYPQELSGGMQQRVGICQSLIYDPEVLLMDEPFGSLDALTKKELNAEFLELWHETKKTVLFVTHDLEEAVFLSDRIVVMSPRPGQIQATIEVDLPRPRTSETRTREDFNELVAEAQKYFT